MFTMMIDKKHQNFQAVKRLLGQEQKNTSTTQKIFDEDTSESLNHNEETTSTQTPTEVESRLFFGKKDPQNMRRDYLQNLTINRRDK